MAQHFDALPSTATAASAPGFTLPEYWRMASAVQGSLGQLGMPRVNALFIGVDDRVWTVLAATVTLASPVAVWRPGDPMHLPENGTVQTLIIREVGNMSGAEQVRLLEWLDRAVGRTQVVSISSGPLMPLVEEGRFINALYYRLNTTCIDLRSDDLASP
jgi:hypothetical protein